MRAELYSPGQAHCGDMGALHSFSFCLSVGPQSSVNLQ